MKNWFNILSVGLAESRNFSSRFTRYNIFSIGFLWEILVAICSLFIFCW